jgi:hypothetical protein
MGALSLSKNLKDATWAVIGLWNVEKHPSSAVMYCRMYWKDVFQPSKQIKGTWAFRSLSK